jgi:dipeptidyl aminopeptidase/acylaminoacyl peptidase
MKSVLTFLLLCFLGSINGLSQNGKIISKRSIDLEQTSIWDIVATNDTLEHAYEYLDRLEFYFIEYESDSFVVDAISIEPKKEGKFPVVIFNRGGNRNFAPLNLETMIFYNAKLADQGYVIIGSNYREKDEFGGAEINDVLYLTETIKEIEKADPHCIGMFGWSRGGMMTYLALSKTDKIKSAIIGNGPTDMFKTVADRPIIETNVLAECVPDYYENSESELRKRSALFWADELSKHTQVLILCATNDTRVDYQQAVQMAEKLSEINYSFELKIFDTDHFFSDKKTELISEVIDWFKTTLKCDQ